MTYHEYRVIRQECLRIKQIIEKEERITWLRERNGAYDEDMPELAIKHLSTQSS